MFATAMPGAGYGYGAQQIGPQGPYGNVFGQPQFGQAQFGQPQFGQAQFGQPQFGQPQLGFSAAQSIPGYGYATPQTVLPLTFGPATVPFTGQPTQQAQGQFWPSQFGAAQLGMGQPQQPQVYVVPVLTPQGWIGQLVVSAGQPLGGAGLGQALGGQQFGGQQFGGQQFGAIGGGVPGGLAQYAQAPLAAPWMGGGYGYGPPQILPQGMIGGSQGGYGWGAGGGALGSQIGGGLGGLGGGYLPFQAQQQIPQQVPQMYVPVVPIGATPFPGQPLGALPIH